MWTITALLAVLLIGVAGIARAATQPPLIAGADSYVDASHPSTNYGTSTQLRADGSPIVNAYVRFSVPALPGTLNSATLRMYTRSKSTGFQVRGVSSSWDERTITYSNAPAPSTTVTASSVAFASGIWVAVSVTPLVAALGPGGGNLSVALTTPSSTAMSLASRESGANAPQLVLDTTSGTPPANTGSAPTISGSLVDGQTLTGGSGGWSGTPTITYAYQWQRCDLLGAGCVNIAGATGQTYQLSGAAGDVGATIRLVVTATNGAGSTSANSTATAVVLGVAPTNSAPPTISGTALVGQTLTVNNGTWSGSAPITFTYRWRQCASGGTGCSDITGAAQPTYTVASGDIDHTLVVVVTATNVAAPGGTSVNSAPTKVVRADVQPSLPVRAGFYYPWFPEAWNQQGLNPFTHFRPSLGYYDSSAASVIQQHIRSMEYGKVDVGISSWWGQGSPTDLRFPLMLSNTDSMGSALRWSIYYEPEGTGNPTVNAIAADLSYVRDHYANDPSYFRIGGSFVVFVYADATDGCEMAARWKQANAGINAYVVLKVFSGFATCADQPDGWHQYAPAKAEDSQAGRSFTISPGFYKATESTPRLPRDLTAWNPNIRDMIASKAPFQLVTTFNEWGEGTSVESADEWATSSGYGAYLDALHANGQSPAPVTPTGLTVTAGDTTASLDWADNTETDLAGYRVYRRASDGTWPAAPITTVTSSNWSNGGLTNGITYAYRVSAYNTAGNESVPSATVTTQPIAPAAPDPVIAAAGDIACDPLTGVGSTTCQQAATSNLLVGAPLATVLTLGDNQYECGGYQAFLGRFDLSWGRIKSLIRPVLGNHEYSTGGVGTNCSTTPNAAGYFDYFDGVGNQMGPAGERGKGYYSYDIGSWHLIALNANCGPAGGCGNGSPQEQWLKADLAAHPTTCTLAYWHQPRFSSGAEHGNNTAYDAFWQDLYAAGADVILNGHDHDYERFAPQTPAEVATRNGIREFVVGTGGKSTYQFAATIQPTSEVRNSGAFGVLELTLHPTSYDWTFVPVAGQTFTDNGTQACH